MPNRIVVVAIVAIVVVVVVVAFVIISIYDLHIRFKFDTYNIISSRSH